MEGGKSLRKLIFLVLLIVLVISACSESNSPPLDYRDGYSTDIQEEEDGRDERHEQNEHEEDEVDDVTTSDEDGLETNKPTTEVFTVQEIFDFEFLRADWTKDLMEEHGFEKRINELGGETTYYDDKIEYVYFDFYNAPTPAVVHVFGEDIPGPREIKVGDSFEEVLNLFPQEGNWEESPFGTVYGNFDPDAEEETKKLSAYVTTYENRKDLTLLTENVNPALRIFFEDDQLTGYSFYLISAN